MHPMHLNPHRQIRHQLIQAPVDGLAHTHDVDTGNVGDGNADRRLSVVSHESLWRLEVAGPHVGDVADTDQLGTSPGTHLAACRGRQEVDNPICQ